MKNRNQILRNLTAILFSYFIVITCFSQSNIGSPSLRNYLSEEYGMHPQNHTILEDKRGVIYIGNNDGVLEYDGVKWRAIKTKEKGAVTSLLINETGRIFVGAVNDFGYLLPDSTGRMHYKSISINMPDSLQRFGNIWDIIDLEDNMYFQSNESIIVWNKKTKKTNIIRSNERIMDCFKYQNRVFLSINNTGLFYIEKGVLIPIEGTESYGKMHDHFSYNDKLYLLVHDSGVFEFSEGHTFKRVFLMDATYSKQARRLTIIDTETFVIGTQNEGVIIITNKGKIINKISSKSGLNNPKINDLFLSSKGVLWCGLDNGICKINVASPLSSYSKKNGLIGTIEQITSHKGKIVVATSTGVSRLNPVLDFKKEELPSFTSYTNINHECWGILSFQNEKDTILLFTDNGGLKEIKPDGSIHTIVECFPFKILQSKKDPNRVFVGLEPGLISVYRLNGKWKVEARVRETHVIARQITEDKEGNVWLGSNDDGLCKIEFNHKKDDFKATKITNYNDKKGIPKGISSYFSGSSWEFAGTLKGFRSYDLEKDSFIVSNVIETYFGKNSNVIVRLSEDYQQNIWVESINVDKGTANVSYYTTSSESNKGIRISSPFVSLEKSMIYDFYHSPKGITWLGGPFGLYRYDSNKYKKREDNFNVLIRNVILNDKKSIFGGTNTNEKGQVALEQDKNNIPFLNYRDNSIKIEYAAQSFENEKLTVYSIFLDGFNENWSKWHSDPKAVFTNLPEGDYVFKVKAKNLFNEQSKVATFSFSIAPPWYRTWWAYLLYLLGFLLIIKGAIEISSKSLKAIIDQKTAEVVAQKDEIEAKNATLEGANIKITRQKESIEEAHKEITDSINYAERIQRSFLATKEMLDENLKDYFVLFQPKDVVSGDFYWADLLSNGNFAIVNADSTGHGVPGAIMSILNISSIEKAIESGLTAPKDIFNSTRKTIINRLKKDGSEEGGKDGMDASIICFDFENMKFTYTAANNPIWVIRNSKVIQIKPDKMPVGKHDNDSVSFSQGEFNIQKGDVIYSLTDGFQDQFGGAKGKKFMVKKMREYVLSISHLPMPEQLQKLERVFTDWKGDNEQVDDVCVIGVRI